jgi:peptide/nickel transport system ATP-binding protein/oligopeptide transport system ATP-binding protein
MTDSDADNIVLQVCGLVKNFPISDHGRTRTLTAVDNVSLDLRAGETLAIIGESGSGKSTLARCIARLVEPTAGDVVLGDLHLGTLPRRSLWKAYRQLQMVFQDPFSSLNPRMTARAIIEEPLRLHSGLGRAERSIRVDELIDRVGMSLDLGKRYPRQLSGGQCQRVAIARALAVEPTILLLDEPTASLDVSVRGLILDLLQSLQQEKRLAYMFISHDLEVVRRIADRVIVLYLGAVIEQGTAEEVFQHPTHPYTWALLSAATAAEYGRHKSRFRLTGEIQSPIDLKPGCRMAPRCPLRAPSCVTSAPESIALSATHQVWCPVTAGDLAPEEVAELSSG